jgi:hypothetical protein
MRVYRLPATIREIPHFTIGKKQPCVLPSFEIVRPENQAHGRSNYPPAAAYDWPLPIVDTSQQIDGR